MDFAWLVPLLALITIGGFMIFALISKARIEKRKDRDEPASSLAKDGSPHVKKDM